MALADLVQVRLVPFIATEDQAFVTVFQGSYSTGFETFGPSIAFCQNAGILAASVIPEVQYDAANLPSLHWAQLNDVLFLTDGLQSPYFLSLASGSFTFDNTSFQPSIGPFGPLNPTLDTASPTVLTAGAATGSTTLTASSTAGINGGVGFRTTDVGRTVRMLLPDALADGYDPTVDPTLAWGTFNISAVTDTTHVSGTAFLRPAHPTELATSQWQMTAWNDTDGWPLLVAFWGGRLWYGNTLSAPTTVWGSYTGNFVDFAGSRRDGTVTDADAVTFALADSQADGIRWIMGAGSAQSAQLGLGSRTDEHVLQSASISQALSATSVQAYRESTYGSRAGAHPVVVGKSLIYPRVYGKKLNEWAFNWQVNGYLAQDLMRLAEHLVQAGGIRRIVWAQEPAFTLWCLTDDNRLLSLTYLKEENVAAWAEHTLGGTWHSAPPQVLDIAIIPNVTIGQDEVWLVVARTIADQEVETLEVLQPPFRAATGLGLEDAWFVDCALRSALTYPDGRLTFAGLDDSRPRDTRGRPYGPLQFGTAGDVITITCPAALFVDDTATHSASPAGKPGSPAGPDLAESVKVLGAVLRAHRGKAIVTGFIDASTLTLAVLAPFDSNGPAAPGEWSLTPRFQTFSGLDHLTGETVSLFGDGADLGDTVVIAGAITLPAPASYVVAGLSYRSDLETVRLETEAGPIQTAVGKVKRVHRLYADLFETIGGWHGPDAATLDAFETRDAGDPVAQAPRLVTGAVRVVEPGGADTLGCVHLMQDRPLPMTVRALVAAVEVGE